MCFVTNRGSHVQAGAVRFGQVPSVCVLLTDPSHIIISMATIEVALATAYSQSVLQHDGSEGGRWLLLGWQSQRVGRCLWPFSRSILSIPFLSSHLLFSPLPCSPLPSPVFSSFLPSTLLSPSPYSLTPLLCSTPLSSLFSALSYSPILLPSLPLSQPSLSYLPTSIFNYSLIPYSSSTRY